MAGTGWAYVGQAIRSLPPEERKQAGKSLVVGFGSVLLVLAALEAWLALAALVGWGLHRLGASDGVAWLVGLTCFSLIPIASIPLINRVSAYLQKRA